MNEVGYDCRPGDVITARWEDGRGNATVLSTFPNGVSLRQKETIFWISYEELIERQAVYAAKLIPIGPDGRLLLGLGRKSDDPG